MPTPPASSPDTGAPAPPRTNTVSSSAISPR